MTKEISSDFRARIPVDDEVAVNDAIDRWHNGDAPNLTIYEYLGWTWDEYAAWVSQDDRMKQDDNSLKGPAS